MIKAFIAVVVELWEFVFSLPGTSERVIDISPETKPVMVPSIQSKSLNTPLATVVGAQVPLLARPVQAFDTQVGVVSFPRQVKVLHIEGDYTHVSVGDTSGWIPSAFLETNGTDIQPRFSKGVTYGADHDETIKIRKLLQDECFGGVLQLPLQAVEFVLWRLQSINASIDWGIQRPRLPGYWQRILKGKPGVHIGIEPKTNAIMEYFSETGKGILGFVTSVHPDQSIVVQSIGKNHEGEYLEEMLSANVWREWRPVFISYT